MRPAGTFGKRLDNDQGEGLEAIGMAQPRKHRLSDRFLNFLDRHQYVPSIFATRDIPRERTLKSSRVRDSRLLKADLRAISEARHHGGVLSPALGEAFCVVVWTIWLVRP